MISLDDDGAGIRAVWEDTELFRYVYRPDDPQAESPRPYFHPVRTLAGDVVTDYRPDDHPWHKGVAWSLPHVGSENFWGGPSYRRGEGYVQLPNDGTMRHEEFGVARANGRTARLEESLAWVTEAGETLFAERRVIEVAAWPEEGAWACGYATTMRNVSGGPVPIGSPTTEGRENAGYGGLFWRGPASFTGGTVLTPDGAGGDEIMGRRGPWLAFTGKHEESGRRSTLVFRDSPGNVGFPCQWFVRSTPFAAVCPAPFFSAEREVPAGGALALRYDFAVAAGDLDAAGCVRLAGKMILLLGESWMT